PNQCLLDGSLTAAPNYPTSDPPKGGYTIPEKYKGYDPSPFYYYSKPNAGFFDVLSEEQQPTGVVIDGRSLFVVTLDDKQLAYYDAPADSCLPGGDPTVCDGIADAPGSFLGFTTSLVGIDQNGVVLNPPLLTWNWTDTYNHTSGGISTTFNNQPVDPGGSGGVTITTINGVQLPSAVPPNQIAITASGLAYSRVTKTFNGTV